MHNAVSFRCGNLCTSSSEGVVVRRREFIILLAGAAATAFARRCLILALFTFCVTGSLAQGSVTKLRVATRVVPPMVVEDKGVLRGFSIDLWDSISARLNRETEYIVTSD